jgi:S-adenosylmethionine:tRNA ribosyltransferase-isomerase
MPDKPYQYFLPPDLIAQAPAKPRDHSRLLVINRQTGHLSHHRFNELPNLLRPTDVLVFNNTKVFPARLHGQKSTGGNVEVLLLKNLNKGLWEIISHPGIKSGHCLNFNSKVKAIAIDPNHIKFPATVNYSLLTKLGLTPLPPYIHSSVQESILRKQYQTIYARYPGSAAAPTAGLHFTARLLKRLATGDRRLEYITLHVGLGTFKAPTPEQISSGKLHSEYFKLSSATAARLNNAKLKKRRIIAVGTTVCRVLEACTDPKSHLLIPRRGETDIFIKPPYQFKFINGLITNFHLPHTSLLMLVSALSSWPIIDRAYREAIRQKYRFYSFGDACLII